MRNCLYFHANRKSIIFWYDVYDLIFYFTLMNLGVRYINLRRANCYLFVWIFLTLFLCILDLGLGVAFAIDYDTLRVKFKKKQKKYASSLFLWINFVFFFSFFSFLLFFFVLLFCQKKNKHEVHNVTIDENGNTTEQSYYILIAAKTASGIMMSITLRGYTIWLINLVLCIYFFTQTFKISDYNRYKAAIANPMYVPPTGTMQKKVIPPKGPYAEKFVYSLTFF